MRGCSRGGAVDSLRVLCGWRWGGGGASGSYLLAALLPCVPSAVLSSVFDAAATKSWVVALRLRAVDVGSGHLERAPSRECTSSLNVRKVVNMDPAPRAARRRRMSAFQLSQHAPPALQLALRQQQQALDLRQLRKQRLVQRRRYAVAERAAGQSALCRM